MEGYNCSISAYEINKLYHDHGNEEKEAQRGQRAIDENDIINIPEILTEADDIRLSKKKYDEKPAIKFEKKRENERTTVVAVVSNKHIDLRVQTLWVNKKRSIATPISEHADINTPKATRGTAPTSNVTHGAENSNQAFIKNKNAIGTGTPNIAEWTTTTTEGNTTEVKSLSEIIAKARHELGFNYTIGHIQGKNVLGQFNRRDKGVRTKKANDLLTFIHEAGHAIDERYKITRNPKEIPQGAKDELDSLLSQEVKAQYPQNQWLSEGMAEYIKEYLRNKDVAIAKYPEFTKHLMSKLNEADQDMLFTFADEVNAYLSKGHETATDAIRFQGETYDFRTPKEKFTDKNDEFRMKWVDSMQGVKRFTRASQDNKAYIMAINSAYSDNRAGDIIFHELRTPDGRYVAPGFRSCFEGINTGNKEEMRLFNEYLVVMHGPERLALGKAVFADDVQNTKNIVPVTVK